MQKQLSNNEIISIVWQSAIELDLQLDEISFNNFGVLWRYISDTGGGQVSREHFHYPQERILSEVRHTMWSFSQFSKGNLIDDSKQSK